MAFALRPGEPLPAGVRRIALEEVDAATAELTSRDSADWDEAVHDARKRMKKLRAVSRLVRPTLGDECYRPVNATCRDAAGLLSEARDAEVLLDTFDALVSELPDPGGAALPQVRAALQQHRAAARRRLPPDSEPVRRAVGLIATLRTTLADWPLQNVDAETVGVGIRTVYGRGRREFAAAYDLATPESFHDWRKRAKYLWYQLRLLQAGWPEVLDPLIEVADQLSDTLGLEHDLTVLEETVTGRADLALPMTMADRTHLAGIMDARRARLRASARTLGERLYAETPKSLGNRITTYWRR